MFITDIFNNKKDNFKKPFNIYYLSHIFNVKEIITIFNKIGNSSQNSEEKGLFQTTMKYICIIVLVQHSNKISMYQCIYANENSTS